jgi:hypothetical protein
MHQYLFRHLRRLLVALCAVVGAAALTGQPAAPAFAQSGDLDTTTQKLFDAVHSKDFAAAQASVEAGAYVDVPGRWGMTAIELAVDKGYFKIAHYLVAVRNFNSGSKEEKSKAVATPAAPAPDSQGQPSPTQSVRAQPVAPAAGAVTASSAAAEPGTVATSPFTVPSQPIGTLTDQPFYAPLAELETTAGREPEADGPAWPTGKPNPFDPGMPAVGSSLQIIGEIGSADPGLALRPAGGFGQPTLEGESPPSLGSPSLQSSAGGSDTSAAASGETKEGSGFGAGVIGKTSDFQ